MENYPMSDRITICLSRNCIEYSVRDIAGRGYDISKTVEFDNDTHYKFMSLVIEADKTSQKKNLEKRLVDIEKEKESILDQLGLTDKKSTVNNVLTTHTLLQYIQSYRSNGVSAMVVSDYFTEIGMKKHDVEKTIQQLLTKDKIYVGEKLRLFPK
jgi:hypothetical protein